jgi:hypothetical protein
MQAFDHTPTSHCATPARTPNFARAAAWYTPAKLPMLRVPLLLPLLLLLCCC